MSPEHQELVRRVEELERRAPVPWSRQAYAGLVALILGVVLGTSLAVLSWAAAERGRRIAHEEVLQKAWGSETTPPTTAR